MTQFINKNFVNMAKQGIVGAILGILAGELLGIFIYSLQYFLSLLTNQSALTMSNSGMLWPSVLIPAGLGAGFGAVIGAIFGAISALKDISKK